MPRGPMPALVSDALLSLMTQRKVNSQIEFARAVKLSPGYICDVLACRRNLSPSAIALIHNAYALTRKQLAELHHRAAIIAGWKLPALPEDQRYAWVEIDETLTSHYWETKRQKELAGRTIRPPAVRGQRSVHGPSGQALLAGFRKE